MQFEEGVDSYVPYVGYLRDAVDVTTAKIKSTMCNCGCLTVQELQKNARLSRVSGLSIREGGAHDVIQREEERSEYV